MVQQESFLGLPLHEGKSSTDSKGVPNAFNIFHDETLPRDLQGVTFTSSADIS